MDGEEFFDQLYCQFNVHFPCYALRHGSGAGFAAEPADDGTMSIVLLTDKDLVRRYHAERGIDRHLAVVLHDAGSLSRFLDRLPETITHVTFDPSRRFHRRYPVAAIREGLAQATAES